MSNKSIALSREKPVVLVVDDQVRNIQVVGNTLSAAGYEILPATSGEQALQRIAARRPDVILLDVLMPEMDGFEVCQVLQDDPETREIPIIFVSAADDQDIIIRALAAGGVDYVTKPFNKSELLLRVRTHVELKDARDHMRELLEMREEFIGILAHDLKNPLTGIRFSAQLLVEKREELPPKLEKLAGTILESAEHMFDFIDQFLIDKARDNQSLSVELKEVDLKAACHDAVERLGLAAANKGIHLHWTPPDAMVSVQADEGALAQVLDNLLSNAIKFSPSDKEVFISIEGSRTVVIRDQGPGFTEADQQRAFQRFVRLSAKPTAGETSTGLGLSIVKRLVTMMGGDVELQSEQGEGATFRIHLQTA